MLSPKSQDASYLHPTNGRSLIHQQGAYQNQQQQKQLTPPHPQQLPPNFQFMPTLQAPPGPVAFQHPNYFQSGSLPGSVSSPSTPLEMTPMGQPLPQMVQGYPSGPQGQVFYHSNPSSVGSFTNYTTSAPQPPLSSNNSFSMPSHPPAPSQSGYYGLDGNNSVSSSTSNPAGMPGAFQPSPFEEDKKFTFDAQRGPTSVPQSMHNEHQHQHQQVHQNPPTPTLSYQNSGQSSSQTHIQDYPQPIAPVPISNSIKSFQNSAQFSNFNRMIQARNQAAEDLMPFPGALNPDQRGFSSYKHHPHHLQRSATYPTENTQITSSSPSSKSASSRKKTGSFLGMSRETAARNRCNTCGKQFKRPSSLQTHKYSHTGEKPFECDWEDCHKLFSVRSNMIRHRKLHARDVKSAGRLPLEATNNVSSTNDNQQNQDATAVTQEQGDLLQRTLTHPISTRDNNSNNNYLQAEQDNYSNFVTPTEDNALPSISNLNPSSAEDRPASLPPLTNSGTPVSLVNNVTDHHHIRPTEQYQPPQQQLQLQQLPPQSQQQQQQPIRLPNGQILQPPTHPATKEQTISYYNNFSGGPYYI